MYRTVVCLALGGMSTLVVTDLVEVIFTTEMFYGDRDLVDI